MIDQIELIHRINNECQFFFTNSHFKIEQVNRGPDSVFYRVQGNSKAINRKKNDYTLVPVIHWFDSYYLFLEIKFISKQSFISCSIFSGEDSDEKKHQLFRAEWDDYDRDDEPHAQPHWHITTDLAISDSYNNFLGPKDNDTFESYQLVKSDIFEINRFHFAMLGNWQMDESHIHKMSETDKIIKWIVGLLKHIKDELQDQ